MPFALFDFTFYFEIYHFEELAPTFQSVTPLLQKINIVLLFHDIETAPPSPGRQEGRKDELLPRPIILKPLHENRLFAFALVLFLLYLFRVLPITNMGTLDLPE